MAFPPWVPVAATASIAVILAATSFIVPHPDWNKDLSVAFIGNSFMFYNDLPRLMEALSDGHISQNSCLRPSAALSTILFLGNGMNGRFNTTNALIEGTDGIHDYGACTVHQLLLGTYSDGNDYTNFVYDYDDDFYDDDDDAVEASYYGNDDAYDDDDAMDRDNNAYRSDARNPCHEQEAYMDYLEEYYSHDENIPKWDFVVMNDASRSPAIQGTRNEKLRALDSAYIPVFQEMESFIPIFIQTHAYWKDDKNMSGLVDIPTFTLHTYEGYSQYADLVEQALPASRKPRIAPVGNAFLIIWEENHSLWERLFHSDSLHPSPLGTFLYGCILHCTIYGRMPLKQVAILDDMSALWSRARRMQPPKRDPNPIPTREEAEYLYHMAERVALYGHTPKVFETLREDSNSRL